MSNTTQKLEISRKEIDLIENALHTQSKILRVQADAGGDDATARLNDVKRVLAAIAAQRTEKPARPRRSGGLAGLLRMMGQTG